MMEDNIFLKNRKKLSLADYMKAQENGRENLGTELPVAVYRLLEYSLRDELTARLGKEEQIDIFRSAGFRAGTYFAEKYLDSSLGLSEFTSQLQKRLEEFKMGVLRIEKFERRRSLFLPFLRMPIVPDCLCLGKQYVTMMKVFWQEFLLRIQASPIMRQR